MTLHQSVQSGNRWVVLGTAAGGAAQSFRYTVTGLEADLSDFMVPLPAARATDVYQVVALGAGLAVLVDFECPDLAVGDRTTVAFRLIAGADLSADDQIDFYVSDPAP